MIRPSKEAWSCLVLVGDCLQWLPKIESGSINLTITDPPYESLDRQRAVGTTTRLKESKASSNPWFESFPNTNYYALYEELHRVHALNTHCYTFCDSETEHVILSGHNPYDHKLDSVLHVFRSTIEMERMAPAYMWTAWPTLSWLKTKRGTDVVEPDDVDYCDVSTGMGYHWRRTGERILFLEKGKRKLSNMGWPDTLLGPKACKGEFPTQKPERVVNRLIQNSSQAGDVVLDCFAGSGIVATLSLVLARRCILIEKNPSEHLRRNMEKLSNVEWRTL